MTIARFARAAGVGVETVRYYQRRGLLAVPPAGRSGQREYDAALLRRLRFIRQAQAAGFTLAEIGELIALDRTRSRARVRALARARLDDLVQRMNAMRQSQSALAALLHACESTPAAAPCPIIDSFAAACHEAGP